MPLILDPVLRVIEAGHQIFILHPGDGKRFYNDFLATGAVFLDIPGIRFDREPDIDDEGVRRQLRMSRAIAGWHKSGRPVDGMPQRRPDAYSVVQEGREAPRYMREVKTLYVDAKPGDLIVVPGPGYNSAVLLAELSEEFDPTFVVDTNRYGPELLPARRVRFLETGHAKYEFGRRAIQLMQNRQAIIRVSDETDRHEFYEHAYGDYVWGDVSGSYMEITRQVVDQKDLTDVLFLTNLFGAMHVALKAGELEKFLSLPLHEATNTYYNRELFGEISIEVHSPGFFGRPMRNVSLAGFVAGMTALAISGISAEAASELVVKNSENGRVSACDLALQDDMQLAMSTVKFVANGHLWWNDVCKYQQASAEQVGLKTKATLIGKTDRVQSDSIDNADQ